MNPTRTPPRAARRRLRGPALAALVPLLSLAGCAGVPQPGGATGPSSASAATTATAEPTASTPATTTASPTPTASASFDLRSSRTITAAGIGNLTVGLPLADGIARRMVVANPDLTCGDVDTDALLRAFPDVHTDWTPSGLRALNVTNTEYATEAGVRVGDTLATLKRAYGADLKLVPRDLDHFASLGGPGDPLGSRFGDTLPVVRTGDGFLLFPIYAGTVAQIEIGRLDASGAYVPYVGQC